MTSKVFEVDSDWDNIMPYFKGNPKYMVNYCSLGHIKVLGDIDSFEKDAKEYLRKGNIKNENTKNRQEKKARARREK